MEERLRVAATPRLGKAVLHEGSERWRLPPAYDLNPVPADLKPRILATAIDLDDATASLDLALSVANYFELSNDEAREIAAEVGATTARWRAEADRLGLSKPEIDRMSSAFEHADLKAALGGGLAPSPRRPSHSGEPDPTTSSWEVGPVRTGRPDLSQHRDLQLRTLRARADADEHTRALSEKRLPSKTESADASFDAGAIGLRLDLAETTRLSGRASTHAPTTSTQEEAHDISR